ncbi:hypothetical protein FACS1894170_01870 [Planctomycetales bacterium]|nr:hypothetical protein FACS1894170_01870 [Planctomycetales bacterium]
MIEEILVNAAGTLAFGGGGIAIVAYIYWKQAESLLQNQKEQIERIATSFEKALDRRDKDFEMMYRRMSSDE